MSPGPFRTYSCRCVTSLGFALCLDAASEFQFVADGYLDRGADLLGVSVLRCWIATAFADTGPRSKNQPLRAESAVGRFLGMRWRSAPLVWRGDVRPVSWRGSGTVRRSGGGELRELQQGASRKHYPLAGVALAGLPLDPNVVVPAEQSDHCPHGIEGRITKLNKIADLKTKLSRVSHCHTIRARRRTRYWTLVPGAGNVQPTVASARFRLHQADSGTEIRLRTPLVLVSWLFLGYLQVGWGVASSPPTNL